MKQDNNENAGTTQDNHKNKHKITISYCKDNTSE